jgi:hypothetical protein
MADESTTETQNTDNATSEIPAEGNPAPAQEEVAATGNSTPENTNDSSLPSGTDLAEQSGSESDTDSTVGGIAGVEKSEDPANADKDSDPVLVKESGFIRDENAENRTMRELGLNQDQINGMGGVNIDGFWGNGEVAFTV